jgi:cysteine synthase
MHSSEVALPPPLQDSILGVIGHTPLVELRRVVAARQLAGRLLAKLEYLNPGGSMKDRIAREMIQQARASGALRPGQAVVELTSGNTGTGLALVCRALGHPFVAVMSRGNTPERARMMRALGAEVVLVDQAAGAAPHQVSGADLALVEERARELTARRRAFRPDQFANPDNPRAHQAHTGPEIWQQAGGQVDVFLHFAGTAGAFTGIARYLKERNPRLRAYVVEPASAPALAGQPVADSRHSIQGGGYSRPDLRLLDRSLVTDYLRVTDAEAVEGARALAAEEGIFAGFSSGAHLGAALRLLAGREAGATIVFLACDSALKYVSTDLFG